VERRFGIDDAVGAVAVHGYTGFYGVCAAGLLLWGYPSSPNPEYAAINPLGQLAGAVIMFGVLGFLPGFLVAKLLSAFGVLRIPAQIEIAGLDIALDMAHDEAVREVIAAERSVARETGMISQP
jgi:Amt family ammonium transporter